jgi:hypothetical protein
MLLQPDFPENPFSLITTKKNRQFAKHLQENGADVAKVDEILKRFYSVNMVRKALYSGAKNPEWLETLAWVRKVNKQYQKAIAALEVLLNDDSIPFGTRETIIKKDIGKLKVFQDFLTMSYAPKPLMKPEPESINQMIVFQSFAVFTYLKKFKGEAKDKDVHYFMVELFRNLYKNTALDNGMKNLTVDLLKKNLIDNADKLRGKYNELEKAAKSF